MGFDVECLHVLSRRVHDARLVSYPDPPFIAYSINTTTAHHDVSLQYKHYGRVSDKRLRQGGSGYESNARLQSRLLDMKHPTAFRLDLIKLFHLFMHEDSLNESDAGLKRSYELTILHQF